MRPAFFRARQTAFVCLLALPAALAWAQPVPALKPGLWEMRSTRTVDGKPAPSPTEGMRNMPPQLRAQIEASMKDKGMGMTADGATRLCLTPDSFELIRGESQGGCKTDYATRTATAWKWHTTCAQPSMSFDGEAAFSKPEAYTSSVTLVSALANAPKRTTKIETRGKWLGASCGDLKPMVVPR